jgi:hypothetical protein
MRFPPGAVYMMYELSGKYAVNFSELLTIYALDNGFFPEKAESTEIYFLEQRYIKNYDSIRSAYSGRKYRRYFNMFNALTEDIKAFPVPYAWGASPENPYDSISCAYMFGDSWGINKMTGTDITDRENIPGRIPVVSMTDGILTAVVNNGDGTFNFTITSKNGISYRYAYLFNPSHDLFESAAINAGQFIGFIGGDGKKAAHVNIEITLRLSFFNRQFKVNPYPFLRFAEQRRAFSGNTELGRDTFTIPSGG